MINQVSTDRGWIDEQGRSYSNRILKQLIESSFKANQFVATKLRRVLSELTFYNKHKWLFDSLTPREQEVLTCLAKGASNKEVSEQLHISLETVKHHRKLIKSKLQIASQADIIKYAQAFNLI